MWVQSGVIVAAVALTEEDAEFGGGGAKRGEEAGLHFEHGHAGGVAGEVDRRNDAAIGGGDGDGYGAESDFKLLVAECVAVAANVAESKAELFGRVEGAGSVLREGNAAEVGLELILREVGKKNTAHGGAEGGKARADVEVDGHDAIDAGAGDVDDVVAVEGGEGEGLVVNGGHTLKDWLGGVGEGRAGGVGIGQGEHFGAEGVALRLVCAGEAQFAEGIEAAADGGAGEAGADAELGDGHLRHLGRESLDDNEPARKGGHEVRVACILIEGDAGELADGFGGEGSLGRGRTFCRHGGKGGER